MLAEPQISAGMTGAVDPVGVPLRDPHGDESSDDEDMKKAFFEALEEQHGGPISLEVLQQWDATLDADQADDSPLSSPPTSPRPARALGEGGLPEAGWLTPQTPTLEAAAREASAMPVVDDDESASGGDEGTRPPIRPAWCAEELDCVVTESLSSRCCSRLESASTLMPAQAASAATEAVLAARRQ